MFSPWKNVWTWSPCPWFLELLKMQLKPDWQAYKNHIQYSISSNPPLFQLTLTSTSRSTPGVVAWSSPVVAVSRESLMESSSMLEMSTSLEHSPVSVPGTSATQNTGVILARHQQEWRDQAALATPCLPWLWSGCFCYYNWFYVLSLIARIRIQLTRSVGLVTLTQNSRVDYCSELFLLTNQRLPKKWECDWLIGWPGQPPRRVEKQLANIILTI